MRRSLYLTLLLGLAGLALARPAQATPTPDDKAAARVHYEKGTRLYNLGDFIAAADEYKEAYKIVAEPVILYNIAQFYRMAKNYDQALFFYRSYERNLTNPAAKREVETRIHKVELLMAAAPRPDEPTTTKSEPSPTATTKPPTTPTATKSNPVASPPPANSNAIAAQGMAATGDRLHALVDLIKANRDPFRACYDTWSAKNPGIEGKFVLVLSIGPDGKLQESDAAGNGLQAPDVEGCLIERAKLLTYPPSANGKKTRFTYPFDFKPHN